MNAHLDGAHTVIHPCAICGEPGTHIDVRWHLYTTETATGWHFDQHDPEHIHLCTEHHRGVIAEPMPPMVAYHVTDHRRTAA